MTTTPVCPETGLPMVRDTRPMTITYKGESATVAMPGWYCDESGESIHTGDDMQVSDEALRDLKNKVDLLDGADIRRIRKRSASPSARPARSSAAAPMRFRNTSKARSRSARR